MNGDIQWLFAPLGIFILGAIIALVDRTINQDDKSLPSWKTAFISMLLEIITLLLLGQILNIYQSLSMFVDKFKSEANLGVLLMLVFIVPYFLGRFASLLFLNLATGNPRHENAQSQS